MLDHKYKVGQIVKIRDRRSLISEYGVDGFGHVNIDYFFDIEAYNELNIKCHDRVVEITRVVCSGAYKFYNMKGLSSRFIDDVIEYSFKPIESRFEILDL